MHDCVPGAVLCDGVHIVETWDEQGLPRGPTVPPHLCHQLSPLLLLIKHWGRDGPRAWGEGTCSSTCAQCCILFKGGKMTVMNSRGEGGKQ